MTPEEKEKYFGVALRACGWNIDQKGAAIILRILEAIDQKGDRVSLRDLAVIQVETEALFEQPQ